MRITDYQVTQQFLASIDNIQTGLNTAYSQLSSGQKVTQSSDNPSDANIVMNMEGDLRQNSQYYNNLTRATNVSQSSYSAVSSLQTVISNAQDIGTTAGDSTTSASTQSSNIAQLNGYIQEALNLGNTNVNGEYLFSGTATTTQPFTIKTDATTGKQTVSYNGSDTSASIPVGQSVSLAAYPTSDQISQIRATIQDLINIRDDVQSGTSTAIQADNTALGNGGGLTLATPLGQGWGGSSCGAANAYTQTNPNAATPNNSCINPNVYLNSGAATFNNFTEWSPATRNQLRGPHYFNMDMNLYRNFAITERLHFGVGVQAFNVFNHPNFATPDSGLGDSTFGTISGMVNSPTSPYGTFLGFDSSVRVVQLSGKIVF